MSSVINTNVASLNAQRNLSTSQSSLATSLQRLSSGLRINSAKDDAAGLAIAARMSTQINGLNQAVRNANDGISLAQTGDGALAEISNNLQRIRELSVQAANSTNSASDRQALDQEVQQRLAEIDRMASQTSFNGQKILDGSFQNATFQVGANAGETIGISLQTSMRTDAIGKIATVTSGTLGAAGVDGHIDVTASTLNFGTAAAAATSGHITFNTNTSNFAAPTALVAGTSTPQTIANGYDFTAAHPIVVGTNVQSGIHNFDFSGAGLAQFDITDGISTAHITLTQNYTNEAGLAAAINTQLSTQLSNVTVAGVNGTGQLTFSNNGILIPGGSTTAVGISNVDANGAAAGLANSAGTTGQAAAANSNANLTIDGVAIQLTGNDGNYAAIASELTTKMQASALGANYSAQINGSNQLVITHAGSTTAVAITGTDYYAHQAGIFDSTGVAGAAATAGNAATVTIGGTTVNLNQNYGSYANMASAIQTQLGSGYSVTSTLAGAMTVSRTSTGSGSTAVDITASSANAVTAGIVPATGTAGTHPVASTNATFYVDGNAVTLNQNYANAGALASAIQGQLTGYTATNPTGNNITIAKTGSLAAVDITGADANATAAGFGFASGTAGTSAGTISVSSSGFSITSGNTTVNLSGTYTTDSTSSSVQKLVDAINSKVSGVFAKVNGGGITLTSATDMTITGSDVFTAGTVSAGNGKLSDSSVTTVDNANNTIMRVDSALTSVNALRGQFGAIQNRFDSAIASLQATSENVSAARSRIQDADFASETANLTRNQILQQAGMAMLAQANALPQQVLTLLK